MKHDAQVLQTMESLIDACVIADNNCDIVGWNAMAEQIFGYSRDQVLGKNVTILMSDAYAAAHADYVATFKKSGIKRLIGESRQLMAQRKDGKSIPVLLSLGEPSNANASSCETKCVFVAIVRVVHGEEYDIASAKSSRTSMVTSNSSNSSIQEEDLEGEAMFEEIEQKTMVCNLIHVD
jgi:PAS domain S-box-containing protein